MSECTASGSVRRRSAGVEANARLTAATGILLLVMLAAEGYTILSIRPLLAWHVAIGLALLPPVALKVASTCWRFARYYLGDPAYRRAGPPHPVLRVLGPVVVLTTAAVFATGIAAWAAGPGAHTWVTLHKASFILWFGAMTIHVLGHIVGAGRLVEADLTDGVRRQRTVPGLFTRNALIALSLVAGIIVAFSARGLAGNLAVWGHHAH